MTVYIGIDNGVSGAISFFKTDENMMFYCPACFYTKSEQSYTKTRQNITRIDVKKLRTEFEFFLFKNNELIKDVKCLIERPMVNPTRFKSTASALRSLEATLIILEEFKIPFAYIDSKEWQKALLPKDCHKEELKKVGIDICKRLYPYLEFIKGQDADSVLICEYLRSKRLSYIFSTKQKKEKKETDFEKLEMNELKENV